MQLLEYYASLRSELLCVLSGVRSVSSPLWWDDTSSNYSNQRKLLNILKKYIELAKPLGVHLVTLHAECGNPQHLSISRGCVVESDAFPENWNIHDPAYKEGYDFIFMGSRFCRCPCSKDNKITEHHVTEKLVYPAVSGKHCEIISNILCDISSAIENAEDRKPRSGIREYILRSIIRLNEAIMPITVDDYLEQQGIEKVRTE